MRRPGFFNQPRVVWTYVILKTVKNALPFFSAVFALLAVTNFVWVYLSLAVLIVHVVLGIFVDASFFYALRLEVSGDG